MSKRISKTVTLALILAVSILFGQLIFRSEQASGISGAIFTTDPTGLLVNGNIYTNALDVYLSGGPGPNAPPTAAGLPDGEYYFQVTDPPGKKLLSTDNINERKFLVNGGIITQYLGTTHNWNPIPEIPNAIVIQLWPFGKTPNKGGVYKAWATPVDKYDLTDPHSFWGFIPRYSKTDNYKVKIERPITKLILDKFYDVNNNGVYDNGDYLIKGWRIDVTDPLGTTNTYYTPRVIDVTGNPGIYTITEDLPSGWEQTAVAVDGTYKPVAVTVTVEIVDGETHSVLYGNREIPPPQAKLIIQKFNDTNNDGKYDAATDPLITGWTVYVKDPDGITTTHNTPIDLVITKFGTYTITEALPSRWIQTAVYVDGVPVTPPTLTVTVEIDSGETHTVLYGNFKIPRPPPIGVSMTIDPISQRVGRTIAFSWEVLTIRPDVIPQKIELKLKKPDGTSFILQTYTNFPTDYEGTKVWTATPPTGTWWIYITYYYTYYGTPYTAGTLGSFTVY